MIEKSQNFPKDVSAYLSALTGRLAAVLGSNLLGVYLQGSGVQSDFRTGKSDLDVIVVTKSAIPDVKKDTLTVELDHRSLPVPGAGLDLMIVTKATAVNPTPEPSYEFWFSSGKGWELSVDKAGQTSEVLVFLAVCREGALALFGPEPSEVFSDVPHQKLLAAVIDILEWHKTKILHEIDDPLGQYSVLNASRAWMYAEDRVLGSKAEGGRWVLKREPNNVLVKNALRIRDGGSTQAPSAEEIDEYLDRVLTLCRQKLASLNQS